MVTYVTKVMVQCLQLLLVLLRLESQSHILMQVRNTAVYMRANRHRHIPSLIGLFRINRFIVLARRDSSLTVVKKHSKSSQEMFHIAETES